MITKFPMLYKKTSTGKIQTWEVWVDGATMCSESGQLDGKKVFSSDTIKEGKNLGKANETTAEEQAALEARARWTAKLKKGYVEKLDGAKKNEVNDIIEGGFNPTLAHSYAKQGDKITFPCAAQPKLDGIRCVAVGSTLWSRTRKAITSVPHISHALRELGLTAKELTDGELYNHDFKDNFEKITTIVGQKKDVEPDHELVQYHIYDFPCDKPYKERLEILKNKFGKVAKLKKSPLKLVETIICNNEEELMAAYDKFTAEGYEGAMARNLNATYEYKRSSHLQKIKEFEDAEFEIIGVEEGRGKLQGHAGAFVCVTEDGTQFKAKMSGDIKHLKNYWEKQDLFIGQMLTVKFQGLTGKNSVPRFPVGLRIRNYE